MQYLTLESDLYTHNVFSNFVHLYVNFILYFFDRSKFKQYIATNPALQKVIEGKSQPKESNIANTAYNNSDI